jgi:hypothetical protein
MTTLRAIRCLGAGLALCSALVSAVQAQDKLDSLRVGNFTYTNVTVTMVTATDIYFTSDNGMGNAKLESLDPALQSYFNYDPARASAAEKARQAGAQRYFLQTASVPSEPAPAAAPEAAAAVTNSVSTNAVPTGPDLRSPAEIQAEINASEDQVRQIVNQPVDPVAAPFGSRVGRFASWFGGETVKPDFNTADVGATQEFPYAVFEFVSSDLDRSVAFPASELESNAMTKFFYTDLSVPKKKLTGDEIKEINRLYRLIGKDEATLAAPNGQ